MPFVLMFYTFWYAPLIVLNIAIAEAIDPSQRPKLTMIRGGKA